MTRATPPAERFWSKVDKSSDCWLWTAGLDRRGYPRFFDGVTMRFGHRFAYQLVVGPIPDGLELDHLCRVPACVNPAHLEPVTHTENVRRGDAAKPQSHCKRGHPLIEGNLYWSTRGVRACRTCALDRERAKRGTAEHREYERLRSRRRRAPERPVQETAPV